jgi:hypothetical protein
MITFSGTAKDARERQSQALRRSRPSSLHVPRDPRDSALSIPISLGAVHAGASGKCLYLIQGEVPICEVTF